MNQALLMAALACGMSGIAGGQTSVHVRSEIDEQGRSWVGQRVRMDVLLFVPGQFSGAPAFDLPDVKDALLLRVGGGDARPTFGSERIDGVTYVSARYQFAAFFQRSGDFTIPSFEVRFASVEGFGGEPEWHSETTPEHRVSIAAPPGTERLAVLVSTSKFDLEDVWGRGTDGARVGDAFTRTISMRALDVPGLLLPVLPLDRVRGLETYPSDPSVDTATARGAFTGSRVERVTYICAREGPASVPPLTLRWWNVETETLESIDLDGVSFDVAPAVANPEVETGPVPDRRRGWSPWVTAALAAIAAGVFVGVFVGVRRRARLTAWFESRRRRRRESERGRFTALRAELAGGDASAALNALYRWLDVRAGRSQVATVEEWCTSVGDPDLDREIDVLVKATADGMSSWSGKRLLALLHGARTGERAAQRARHALPPLN